MELGDTTQDIAGRIHRAERHLDPEVREAAIRRRGSWQRGLGAILFVGSFFATLVGAQVSENEMYSDGTAELFGILGIIALVAAGGSMFILGWLEKLQRFDREMVRQALLVIGDSRDQLRVNAGNDQSRYESVMGHVAAVPTRLNVVEERLSELVDLEKLLEDIRARLVRVENVVAPESGYVQGVEDGLRMGRKALDPDEL